MPLNCVVGKDSWESLGQQGDQTSQSQRKSTLKIHWKDWCWSSITLAIWCEELMYGKDSDAGKDGGQEGKRVTEDEMVRSPCSPRDSKKSSASQFNSINSLVLLSCGVGEDSWESLGLQGDLTISSSVVPFSSCLQSFPASGSFPVSQFLASGGQRIGASAPASVLPMNIQDWFPSGWTGWISLQSKGLSRVFSNTTV